MIKDEVILILEELVEEDVVELTDEGAYCKFCGESSGWMGEIFKHLDSYIINRAKSLLIRLKKEGLI